MKDSLDGLDITNQVELFRQFLNNSWDDLDELMYDHDWEEDGDFTDEWIQVNWESLVEKKVTKNKSFISSLYMHNSNKRMTNAEKKHEYLVLVKPKKKEQIINMLDGKEIDFSFDVRLFGFRKALNPGLGFYPPFDLCALRNDKKNIRYIVPLDELTIYLKKVC